MRLDLEHLADLALFARVVEQRSFTAAAATSRVAKSAVSRRIALLERRLGVQLLRRTTRALSVTPEGARVYEHCARLLESAREAERAVAGAERAVRGVIRVSAPVTFSQMHLVPSLAAFLRAHRDAEIDLVASDHFVDVVADGFDLVIRVARIERGSFVARKLASDRLVIAAAPAYLAEHGRPTSPEDLVHHVCLHYDLVPRATEWRVASDREAPIPVRYGRFTTNDGTVLRNAALEGLGLAVTPSFMVAADVAAGRLELVLTGAKRAEVGIHAIVASGRALPARTRALLDHLVRWFEPSRWDGAVVPRSRARRS
jgi:DNA-binding transcriptional LysR family regulator